MFVKTSLPRKYLYRIVSIVNILQHFSFRIRLLLSTSDDARAVSAMASSERVDRAERETLGVST